MKGSCRRDWKVLGLVAGLAAVAAAGEECLLYSYHNKPPYYAEFESERKVAGPWIYEDLARYLNERQAEFQVKIQYLPRVRLERDLERGTLNGGVVGVNPLWFKDKDQTRYLWTAPFMEDRDVVVVQQGKAFPYAHPRDLAGKRLTLPRGLYWWGVTELILEGKIQAEYTDQDQQNLEKVALGRADATITSYLSFVRLAQQRFPQGGLECLPVPHDRFERRILFPHRLAAQHRALAAVLEGALADPAWRERLAVYGVFDSEKPAP